MAATTGPDDGIEQGPASEQGVSLVQVYEQRPEGYDGTCLRPLGLCELGGCCDVCWYRPDHPRFARARGGDGPPESG